MRLLGTLRALFTWVVGAWLLAAALGGPLLWFWISPLDNRGQAMALLAGPICALMATPYTTRLLLFAARALPAEPTPALLQELRSREVVNAQVWLSARIGPGEGLAVRGRRRRYLVLPSKDGETVDETTLAGVEQAAPQLRSGSAAVVPLFVALTTWLRRWVDLVRFGLQGFTTPGIDWYVRPAVMGLFPISVVAAPMVLVAYVASLLMLPLVGPGTARRVARAFGTEDGRPRELVRHRFRYVPAWAHNGSRSFTTSETETVPTDADRRPGSPVHLWGLPRAVAAGMAETSSLVRLPVALLIVMMVYFAATIPAQRLLWHGETAATGTVVHDDRPYAPAPQLVVRTPDGQLLQELPQDFTVHEGQTVRLAATGQDGRPHYRLRDDTGLSRNLITIGVWLPLALVPAWALDRMVTSDLTRLGDERSGVRRRRWQVTLTRLRARAAGAWPAVGGTAAIGVFGGWVVSLPGALVGRFSIGTDAGSVIGGLVGFVLTVAGLGYLFLVRWPARRRPTGGGQAARSAEAPEPAGSAPAPSRPVD
ncbi:hypothetical protein [Oryzihumus sp.]